jgi:hypothetical protein
MDSVVLTETWPMARGLLEQLSGALSFASERHTKSALTVKNKNQKQKNKQKERDLT